MCVCVNLNCSKIQRGMSVVMCEAAGSVSSCSYFESCLSFVDVLFLSSVFCLTAGIATSERCDQNELMRCSTPLPGLSSPTDLSIGLNKEELEKSCIELQAGIRCINNYTEHCMTPVERRRFNSMYEGVNSVMRSLCQAGRYQDDYLRHAECIKKVKPEYEMCSKTYELTLTTVSAQGDRANTETEHEYLRIVCCSFQEYLLCSEQMVQRTCGEEAAVFTSVFLKRMSSNIIKSYCLEYRGQECGTQSSAHREGPSWLVLSTIACSISLLAHLVNNDAKAASAAGAVPA